MSNLKGFETEADKNLAAGQTIKADVMNTNFMVQHKAAVTWKFGHCFFLCDFFWCTMQ